MRDFVEHKIPDHGGSFDIGSMEEDAQMHMDMAGVMSYMHEFYFESAAMILALITVGKMLEARSKGRTTDALKSLMKLAPKTAVVVREIGRAHV